MILNRVGYDVWSENSVFVSIHCCGSRPEVSFGEWTEKQVGYDRFDGLRDLKEHPVN